MNTKELKNLPGVYIIKNLINGKYYIGESINVRGRVTTHLRNSKQIIHKAIKKHGIENFEVYAEYFPNFSKDDLWDLEEQLIIKFNSIAPNGYNINPRGTGSTGYKPTEEQRRHQSVIRKGKKKSEDHKRKISEAHKGKKKSIEHVKKLAEIQRGKKLPPRSEESKRKISIGNKGKKRTKEQNEARSLKTKGKKLSEETKLKKRETTLRNKLAKQNTES